MKKSFGLTAMLLILIGSLSAARELPQNQFDLTIASLKGAKAVPLYNESFLAQTDEEFETPPEKEPPKETGIYEYSYKSPKKAFLMSLLVPGLGQIYSGSSIVKTAAFLLAEGGSWAGYVKFHGDGQDKIDAFQLFANTHWFEGDTTFYEGDTTQYQHLETETYRGWLVQNNGDVEDTSTSFTHTLPDEKNQQYYEMIGKYDQFRGGWDDYWTLPDTGNYVTSLNRDKYESMRKEANDDLDLANNMIYISMAVHLVSAIDAAISANRHNNQSTGDNWSIKTEMRYYSATDKIPIIKVTRMF